MASGFQFALVEQTFFVQRLRADIVMIARKGRGRLIRTIAVCGGIERQNLPTLGFRRAQKVYEAFARRAESAYAPLARKRTHRHKHSAFSFETETVSHCAKRCARSVFFRVARAKTIYLIYHNRHFDSIASEKILKSNSFS